MIGLSLSFCVADILYGKVRLEDVKLIITGTACRTPEQWAGLLEQYKQSYWQFDERQVANPEDVLRTLLESGRIYQPRLHDEEPPRIGRGFWVEDESSLAKERDCNCCMNNNVVLGCHILQQEELYPLSFRNPVVPTTNPETSAYQLGCYYFSKR